MLKKIRIVDLIAHQIVFYLPNVFVLKINIATLGDYCIILNSGKNAQ